MLGRFRLPGVNYRQNEYRGCGLWIGVEEEAKLVGVRVKYHFYWEPGIRGCFKLNCKGVSSIPFTLRELWTLWTQGR